MSADSLLARTLLLRSLLVLLLLRLCLVSEAAEDDAEPSSAELPLSSSSVQSEESALAPPSSDVFVVASVDLAPGEAPTEEDVSEEESGVISSEKEDGEEEFDDGDEKRLSVEPCKKQHIVISLCILYNNAYNHFDCRLCGTWIHIPHLGLITFIVCT